MGYYLRDFMEGKKHNMMMEQSLEVESISFTKFGLTLSNRFLYAQPFHQNPETSLARVYLELFERCISTADPILLIVLAQQIFNS